MPQGRGLRNVLVEQDDLAAHTSSASTKLIHGGLRYLEQYEFSLVRKALPSARYCWRRAAHRAAAALRHAARPGHAAAVDDPRGHVALRSPGAAPALPASAASTCAAPGRRALEALPRGFEYSDGWVDDARLVVLNAMDAAVAGREIRTRCRALGGEPPCRSLGITSGTRRRQAEPTSAPARWSMPPVPGPAVSCMTAGHRAPHGIRLVKGSHIVVTNQFDHPYAYIFQNADKRIVFAIPYEHTTR